YADAYVECVSAEGLPQRLIGLDGKPVAVTTRISPRQEVRVWENSYYPSPEMHREAARRLAPTCVDLLRRHRSGPRGETGTLRPLPARARGSPRTSGWARE